MNQKELAFILAYLKTSDKEEAYRIANNDYHSSQLEALSRAIFILQDPEIAKEIEDIRDNIKIDLIVEMESTLPLTLTVHDTRVLLSAVATGEMYAYAHGAGKQCPDCGMHEQPTFEGILSAVQNDCKPCIAIAYTFMMAQQMGKNKRAGYENGE